MASPTSDNTVTVGDGLFGYVQDTETSTNPTPNNSSSVNTITPNTKIDLTSIPQGQGSTLDADKVDGLHATPYLFAGNNILVATNDSGILPLATGPTQAYYAFITFGGF